MICRLTAPGWETFTGSMGHGARFENGVSVEPLTMRQIARIGSSTILVNDETGEQVGPSVVHLVAQPTDMVVPAKLTTATEEEVDADAERLRLIEEENERKAAEAVALAEAQAKAQAAVEEQVFYTRQELEAIGANDGIAGLRVIATPLGLKGRGISELVNEILTAQAKLAAE